MQHTKATNTNEGDIKIVVINVNNKFAALILV